MFGGLSKVNDNKMLEQQSALSDIWLFRVGSDTWTELTPTPDQLKDGLPSARSFHQLSTFRPLGYDYPLVLMFGGRLHTNQDTDETWVFELLGNKQGATTDTLTSKWYKLDTTTQPSKRTGHAMSRLGRNSVVLFGGYDAETKTVLGDTWVFIGSKQATAEWMVLPKSQMTTSATSFITGVDIPVPRRFASFSSFDAETAILFGGTSEDKRETQVSSPFSDGSVWHLSRNTDNLSVPVDQRYTWRRIRSLTPYVRNPVPRYGHASATVSGNAFDKTQNSSASVFIFGGRGIDNSSMSSVVKNHQDTWIFHGGCPLGTFRNINHETGCEGCYACPIGTYKNATAFTGLNNCLPCPTGTSTPWEGASQLYMCNLCSYRNGRSLHKGQCNVDQRDQTVHWECSPNYYGDKFGEECTHSCNCHGGDCDDGFTGTGTCHCFWIFWLSPDCSNPLIFVLAMIILVAVVVGCLYWYYRTAIVKRSLERHAMHLEVSQTLREEEHFAEVKEFEEGWKIDGQDLTFCKALARGGYGEVWKGKYPAFPGETVAIKIFFVTPDSDVSRGAFGDREVALLAKTPPHKNIVFVIGAGQLRTNSQIFLVSEFMSGGDLRSLLDDYGTPLSWERRLQIASDVSEGMLFLHTRGMIHRDLKSLNILLDGTNGRAKIADFGLSKVTGSHHAILRQCTAKNKRNGDQSFLILSQNNTLTSSNGSTLDSNDSTSSCNGAGDDGRQQITKKAMLKMAIDMENALCRKNRLWFRGTREFTFKGSDAVAWLVTSGRAHDPRSAMALGTHLLQAGYFSLKSICESDNDYESSYETMLDDKRMIYVFDSERLGGRATGGENDGSSGSGSGAGDALNTSLLSEDYSSDPSDFSKSFSSDGGTKTESGSGGGSGGGGSGGGGGGGVSPYQTYLTGQVGSLLWMAPEIMEQNGATAVYGLETDVYSFAIVLYEIFTRRYPWDDVAGPIWSTVSTLVKGGQRPKLSNEEASIIQSMDADSIGRSMYSIMVKSWAHNPRTRPNFDVIAHELGRLMEKSLVEVEGERKEVV